MFSTEVNSVLLNFLSPSDSHLPFCNLDHGGLWKSFPEPFFAGVETGGVINDLT